LTYGTKSSIMKKLKSAEGAKMMIFLTSKEIIDLTGAKQPEKQRSWFSSHGFLFEVRLNGSNVVLRSHLEQKLGGISAALKSRKTEPNIIALERMTHHAKKAQN